MIALLVLLGFAIPNPKTNYSPVSGIEWASCNEYSFNVNYRNVNYPVNYTYCTDTNRITPNLIEQKMPEITQAFFSYIDSLGMRPNLNCPREKLLEIYEVRVSELNDPHRFYEWKTEENQYETIWGLYDTRLRQPGYSAITITHQYSYTMYVFSHEVAHYWADRLCLNQYEERGEVFATNFESFYVRQYGF